jgi:hypothetical protein
LSLFREVPGGEKSTSPWLDPEDFPFTRDELFQAASLWLGAAEARAFADDVAEFKRRQVRDREAHRMRLDAHPEQRDKLFFAYTSGDRSTEPWLMPALSVLSASCAARVESEMARSRELRLRRALEQDREALAALIDGEKREWLALAAASRARLDARSGASGSPPAAPPRP